MLNLVTISKQKCPRKRICEEKTKFAVPFEGLSTINIYRTDGKEAEDRL